MTIVYYPRIRPQDYDSFRNVLNPNLPNAYHEWLKLQSKEMREIVLRGDNPVEIEVNPYAFGNYCQSIGARRDLKSLKDFAAEKAAGKRY